MQTFIKHELLPPNEKGEQICSRCKKKVLQLAVPQRLHYTPLVSVYENSETGIWLGLPAGEVNIEDCKSKE